FAGAAPALAATGGTTAPINALVAPMGQDGGTPAPPNVVPGPPPAKAKTVLPTLASFSVGASRFSDKGRGLPLSFKLAGTTGAVHVRLHVYSRSRLVASFDLGQRATGSAQRYLLSSRSAAKLPSGNLILRLVGADSHRHRLRANLQASAAHVVSVSQAPRLRPRPRAALRTPFRPSGTAGAPAAPMAASARRARATST